MDREPAVIRAEMNQTRAELGRKIGLLEARARELTPAAAVGAVCTGLHARADDRCCADADWGEDGLVVLAKRAQAGTRSGRAGVVRQRQRTRTGVEAGLSPRLYFLSSGSPYAR